jgi:hypothetical protein
MSMKLNPNDLAHANRDALKDKYEIACERLRKGGNEASRQEFEERLASWTVSMNMRADDLDSLLEKGYHRNIYSKLADELEDLVEISGYSSEIPTVFQAMENDQPGWYPKRMAYYDRIESEARIKYGAVCAEGNGATYYGPFTVLLKRDAVQCFQEAFFLRTDSLFYVGEDFSFDENEFKVDLAVIDNVLQLGVVKHEVDIESGCETAMEKLCFALDSIERSYIEAQIMDPVKALDIGEVRWSVATQNQMEEIPKRKLNGKIDFRNDRDALDILIYERFKRIHKKVRNLGLKFTVYAS